MLIVYDSFILVSPLLSIVFNSNSLVLVFPWACVYLLLVIRFDGPFTDPFFLFFFFFPLWVQGATSIHFRLSKQKLCWHWTCPKYNHGRACSIMSRSNKKLWQFNFGQSLWDKLWGACYITIYIYIYHHHLLVFDLEDSITNFTHLFQVNSHVIISHISKFIAWALCFIKFLALVKLLKAFDQLQWVRFCISWLIEFYVCNFLTLFMFICQLINSEW